MKVQEIRENPYDLNVEHGGRVYGVWKSDRGEWSVADIDGHVWTVRTKEEALAKIEEIQQAIEAKLDAERYGPAVRPMETYGAGSPLDFAPDERTQFLAAADEDLHSIR